jgi:branched-subunit amino acid transport protein
MTTWLVILAVGAGSYALRVLPLLLDGRWPTAPAFERAMAHAGTAGLAALAAVAFDHEATTPRALAGLAVAAVAALVIAVRGGSMLRVMVAGAGAYAVVMGVTALVS